MKIEKIYNNNISFNALLIIKCPNDMISNAEKRMLIQKAEKIGDIGDIININIKPHESIFPEKYYEAICKYNFSGEERTTSTSVLYSIDNTKLLSNTPFNYINSLLKRLSGK